MSTSIELRVARLESDMSALTAQLGKNTIVLNEIAGKVDRVANDTGDLTEIFRGAKTGARVILFMGRVAKWVGGVAAAIAAAWYVIWAVRTGNHPFPPDKP